MKENTIYISKRHQLIMQKNANLHANVFSQEFLPSRPNKNLNRFGYHLGLHKKHYVLRIIKGNSKAKTLFVLEKI